VMRERFFMVVVSQVIVDLARLKKKSGRFFVLINP